jgi:hypothetical protein
LARKFFGVHHLIIVSLAARRALTLEGQAFWYPHRLLRCVIRLLLVFIARLADGELSLHLRRAGVAGAAEGAGPRAGG